MELVWPDDEDLHPVLQNSVSKFTEQEDVRLNHKENTGGEKSSTAEMRTWWSPLEEFFSLTGMWTLIAMGLWSSEDLYLASSLKTQKRRKSSFFVDVNPVQWVLIGWKQQRRDHVTHRGQKDMLTLESNYSCIIF